MTRIGILYLTKVSEHPNPFISTGNLQIKRALDKIARFTHNFVICARVPTGLMGPTGQGIMKLVGFSIKSVVGLEIRVFGYVKDWFGVRLGMNIEIIVILALVILNLALTLISTRVIAKTVLSMDESLARAIQTTIENLPEALRSQYLTDVEPPNPFQMLIAKYFEDKIMNPNITAEMIEVKKGKDGKFV